MVARDRFRDAHADAPLGADDLAALADCSWWRGDIDQCLPVQQEVYRLHVEASLAQADEDRALRARHGDANLVALGVLGRGRVLVKQGRLAEGMALLDEDMVAAVSDELNPGGRALTVAHRHPKGILP